MTILWSNNASTTISGSIAATDTTVALAAGTGIKFPNPTSGNYYVATFYDQATKTRNEIVHVTAMAGDVATIVRGQEGTTPQAWNAGDIFANLITAGTLEAFVQAGTGAADTSLVYVGTDVGTQNHIVADTIPVPSALAIGMLFNILVANTNSGATDVQLNGIAAIPLTRNNGAPLSGGDITATEEVTFVYNGVAFNTMIPDIKAHPPVTTFYVDPNIGNDSYNGWAPTVTPGTNTGPFRTIYGAVNNIQTEYISQTGITLRCADGTYIGGFVIYSTYIAQWSIIGNITNPQNCILDATSVSPAPGAATGFCVQATQGGVGIQGFTFKSYLSNVMGMQASVIEVANCNFTAPTAGRSGVIGTSEGGLIGLTGNNTYNGNGIAASALIWAGSGIIILGTWDPTFGSTPCVFEFIGNPTFGATYISEFNGLITHAGGNVVSFTGGAPQGPAYVAQLGGGIITNGVPVPGSQPGVINQPAWVQ